MEQGQKERRRFPRIRSDALLRFKKIAQDEFFRHDAEGLTKNISGGGIRFECAGSPHLEMGDMVALNLRLEEFPATILALGRVVRVEDASAADRRDVAVEFWWIGWDDETAQRAISDYIRRKLD